VPDYDAVADRYAEWRGPVAGVGSVLAVVDGFGAPPRVLDLGCGDGRPIAMAAAGRCAVYTGVDMSPAMIRRFRINAPAANAVVADIAEFQPRAGGYDLVFAWGVLFHLSAGDQLAALANAMHALRRGGLLLFTSGRIAGRATGSVGPLRVEHVCLGYDRYDDVLRGHGMQPVSCKDDEFDNTVYLYRKRQSV